MHTPFVTWLNIQVNAFKAITSYSIIKVFLSYLVLKLCCTAVYHQKKKNKTQNNQTLLYPEAHTQLLCKYAKSNFVTSIYMLEKFP